MSKKQQPSTVKIELSDLIEKLAEAGEFEAAAQLAKRKAVVAKQ